MEAPPTAPRILITGASRGIGRACAQCFAGRGYAVTAVARNETQLDALAAEFQNVVPLVADLRQVTIDGDYEVVVLNAGYYAPGGLLDERDVFGDSWPLNVMANHRLARSLLPSLIRRGSGHLVAIGSSATENMAPHMTAYATSKKMLRALFEGWQIELAGTGVRSTLLAPGATLTSSWEGESPPPRILRARQVAELVYRAVAEGLTGRIEINP